LILLKYSLFEALASGDADVVGRICARLGGFGRGICGGGPLGGGGSKAADQPIVGTLLVGMLLVMQVAVSGF
jgi:hypothetical protein